jgi:ferredoxin-NADP reductase
MPIHILKLLDRREVARDTIEFIFEKPAGLIFKPGQYAGFTLINPSETDAGGITRRFSLLSSPDDTLLAITTRIQQSAYKRVLNALPIGGEIKFAGPTGSFTLHEDKETPAVFIAGGIGITPFYSMIKYATQHKSTQPLTLFYGNQTEGDTAYLIDLIKMAQDNPHFTLIPTMASPSASWSGETGYITHTMIKKYIPDLNKPIYYICGSPVMVTALQELLAEMDINEDTIHVEDFPGY